MESNFQQTDYQTIKIMNGKYEMKSISKVVFKH